MILIDTIKHQALLFYRAYLGKISAATLDWLAIVFLHLATIPSLLAVHKGLTDKVPSLDVVLFVWMGLLLIFGRSVIKKDTLNTVTVSLGFVLQAALMAMILFK